jgi:hypothetical protein
MAKPASVISSNISNISKKELEKLVLKAASKDKSFHDYLLVNYFDKEFGEQDLFEEAKNDINSLMSKRYKGYAAEQQLANMLAACSKRISEFSKTCKNKNLEADLILFVLEIPFSADTKIFRTCFTALNYKVVVLLKRLIVIVQTKLHLDFKVEYLSLINEYLGILHSSCGYLDYVNVLPKRID